jgi:acyl-CoA synthetase (AMP-forming)/AMP-acid ligase II
LRASRRARRDFAYATASFVIVGDTERERAQNTEAVKQQIAFYASTRTYEPVLTSHGWEGIVMELHRKSLQGDWKGMTRLIWLRTGDVVTIDPEGYMKITDRSKDLIKSGGEWISSVDLENALVGHLAVREAAVVAVPDAKWVERPVAVVVVKGDANVTPDELRCFLAERFAKWQLPDAFIFVPELPHTSTGKLLKSQLREQFKDWPLVKAARDHNHKMSSPSNNPGRP